MLDVESAKKELGDKSYGQIQEETAWKWASRACASYENVVEAQKARKLIYWTIAEELYHEAVEHAALSGSDELLVKIRDSVHPYQEKAAESMGVDPEALDIV